MPTPRRTLRFTAPALAAALVCIAVAGCGRDGSGGQQQISATTRERSSGAEAAPAATAAEGEAAVQKQAPSTPLDLSYKNQPGDPADGSASFTPRVRLPDLFKAPDDEDRLSVSGRLLLNDTERDPTRAVEGGEVGVEVKTD